MANIESVKPADLPDDTKEDKGNTLSPDAIDGSQQTENADDNARPAPDAGTPVPADTDAREAFTRADDFLTRGYLTEDDAWDAIGDDDSGFDVIPEGTAWKIIENGK